MREVPQSMATVAKMTKTSIRATMAVEPERFCTAWEMISMKGNPVFVPRAVEMSPMQNKTAISMAKPSTPLSAMLMIILRGTTVEAFAISSHMWTAPSAPRGSVSQEEDKAAARSLTKESVYGGDDTDEEGQAKAVISSRVQELLEHVGGRSMGSIVNQGPEDAEESNDVEEENGAFYLGQLTGEKGVEDEGKDHDGEDEESSLPAREVAVGVCENQDALEDGAGKVAGAGQDCLPRNDGLPSGDVAEEVLPLGRRELMDPMVLSARHGRHGHQLGHRSNHGEITQPAEDEAIDETGRTAVGEAVDEDAEDTLPGDHESGREAQDTPEAKVSLQLLDLAHECHLLRISRCRRIQRDLGDGSIVFRADSQARDVGVARPLLWLCWMHCQSSLSPGRREESSQGRKGGAKQRGSNKRRKGRMGRESRDFYERIPHTLRYQPADAAIAVP